MTSLRSPAQIFFILYCIIRGSVFHSQLNPLITIQGNRIINIFSGCFLLCEILFVRRVVDLKFRTFFREKGKRIRQNREKSRKN